MIMPANTLALVFLFCGLMLPIHSLAADSRTSVLGYWVGESSILHIENKDGLLQATVVALRDPVYLDTESLGTPGAPRTDDNNPDPLLQNRTLLGMNLLEEYGYNGSRWEGKIYDPESGNTYSSRMSVDRKGQLNMRGYIGAPMFGRTAVFLPLKQCSENVRVMLTRSQLELEACRS
jgi:uncharacterized protein (DUF2147 family)